MKRLLVVVLAALALAACGDDEGVERDTGSPLDEDVRSFCDSFGNRVYVGEDDNDASPSVFVLKDDCAP